MGSLDVVCFLIGSSSGLRVTLARLLTRRVQFPRLPPRFCPHSIMDNTLVYETGDCGSIPYVGAKIEYRVSSVVEQRLDKALVASSNLASGTKKQLTTTAKGCIIKT